MNPPDYWKNRRRMAWLSLFVGLIGFPLMCMKDNELLVLAGPMYLFIGVTVGLYKWTALSDDKSKRGDAP